MIEPDEYLHILQLMCPSRHCFVGVAYHPKETTRDESEKVIEEGIRKLNLLRVCAICDSTKFHYEDGATQFKTIEEATPWLAETMEANLRTREAVLAHKIKRN